MELRSTKHIKKESIDPTCLAEIIYRILQETLSMDHIFRNQEQQDTRKP